MNIRKNSIALCLLFFPTILAHILGFGDPRTSVGFSYAPSWFPLLKYMVYLTVSIYFVFPVRIKFFLSDFPFFIICITSIIILFHVPSSSPANNLVIRALIYDFGLIMFLMFIKSNKLYSNRDIYFLLILFLIGFISQIVLLKLFSVFPSHTFISSSGLKFRYNGITNDSLATGLLLPVFVPIILHHKYSLILLTFLLIGAYLTHSLFGLGMIYLTLVWYSVYTEKYKISGLMLLVPIVLIIVWLPLILETYSHKWASIIVHSQFFLNIFGLDPGQSSFDCGEKFCESFMEMMLFASKPVFITFYLLLLSAIYFLHQRARIHPEAIIIHSVLCLGVSILAASFIHPVTIIPYSLTLFIFGIFFIRAAGAARPI